MTPAGSRKSKERLSKRTHTMPNLLESFDVQQFLSNTGIGRTRVKVSKRSCVYAQGADCDAIYYLQKGSLRLTIISDHGKVAVIAILGAGDFIGEECASTTQSFRSHSAYTLTDCLLLRITKSEMARVVREEPEMSATFVAFLLARTSRIQSDLVDQLFNSSEKRLARTLLLLANFGNEGMTETLVPPISQETLAAMIGTTRSRVSFFLSRFRRLGYIEYDHQIKVNKSLLQVVLHD
jgi:CRP/FNR family cyclic AMP-dependent transcriptional regulator